MIDQEGSFNIQVSENSAWKTGFSTLWLPFVAMLGKIVASLCTWQDMIHEHRAVGVVNSPLPTVVLMTGILVAVLLGLTVYFAQKAARRLSVLKKVNEQFQGEMNQRRQAEEELRTLARSLEKHVEERTRELVRQKADAIKSMRDALDARRLAEKSEEKMIRQASELAAANQELKKQIDERKHLESQLSQAQKMEAVGRLAGGVAHDFNNILMVIQGYCDVLLRDTKPCDSRYKKVQEMQKSTDRAAELIRQLLAFSRQQIICPKVVDLNGLVKNLEKMLLRVIGEDVELITRFDSENSLVKVDIGQMEQVLVNLAVNARDAMPRGGKLIIETEGITLGNGYKDSYRAKMPKGEYVQLAITDTGCGMSKEIQKHIFEPFFTTKGKENGTGLGLATSYGIIRQNSGYIWVYSEEGQGTTFKIYLPRIYEKVSNVERGVQMTEHLKGTETVLLVEDDAAVRQVTVDTLKDFGYRISEASNGEEALRLIRQNPHLKIDLLMTDIVMPKMGGRDLVDRVKSIFADTKILYTSGYTDDIILRHGILEEKIAFLQKPYSQNLLLSKVRSVLDEQAEKAA